MKQWYKKKYQVLFIDIYNNIYEIGWYDNLQEAEGPLNKELSLYILNEEEEGAGEIPEFGINKNLGILDEVPGTLGPSFDRIIYTTDGIVQVRGFVR